MALTTRQQTLYTRTTGEITDIETRFKVSHNLGDSHSVQGMTTGFTMPEFWRKRLDALYRLKDMLDSLDAGDAVSQPGINLSNWVAG
jgi:hypothetical protein